MTHPSLTPATLEIIRRGGLVIFPTETLYGLGCCALDEMALRRLFAVKGRALGQPPPVLVAGLAQLHTLAARIPDLAAALIEAHWPGSLTLILPARDDAHALLTGVVPETGLRTIGVRHSAHPLAQSLCEAVGTPIVATSANYTGATGRAALPHSLADIPQTLQDQVDVVLDGGTVMGQPSTIVDCTGATPRILRQGALILDLPG